MKISLNGKWQFSKLGADAWKEAIVPGCNYLDLMRNGDIPDPFVSTNEKKTYWVAEKDWEYKRTFFADEEFLSFDKVFLVCDMLDTICEIYLNGNLAGRGENAHIGYSFDIKELLKNSENEIRIVFFSPVKYAHEQRKLKDDNKPNGDSEGIAHIRKPQCHFGWDWGPNLPPSGINRNIEIQAYNTAKIDDVCIRQTHSENCVKLDIALEAEQFSSAQTGYEIEIISPDGETLEIIKGNVNEGKAQEEYEIINPELWWVRELSDKEIQPLYTVKARLFKDKTLLDERTQKIGLRVIELNREKDEYGRNFQFKINGVPLFIKGVNWIPPDSFIDRYTEERLEYDLNAIRFSNMNMIRIWGGGYYGDDLIYEKCDEYGILLWQEFGFACRPYPFFDDELLNNVEREVEYNVKRLRNHASLALWCGNNEIELLSYNWITNKKYLQWTEKFFYNILPSWLEKFDNITPYIPGSPCGIGHMKGTNSDNVGNTHLWQVWHGLQPLNYYRKRMTRFCSEFGFESLPDMKTIEYFAKPSDYSLSSEVFSAHQKCWSGNSKMVYYISSRFRLPNRFEDYVYLSQICQVECVRDATEHWRRNKGRCNGSIYWQFNDCWPVCSWAGMDYFGNYKAIQYCARHFNQPITLSAEDTKERIKIVAINDTIKDVNTRISVRLMDFGGRVYVKDSAKLSLKSLNNETVFTFSTKNLATKVNLKKAFIVAELFIDDKLHAQKTVLFFKEKSLKLPKAVINKRIEKDGDTARITLKADKYVRFLQLYSKTDTTPFSDNFFDLIPNEEKTVYWKTNKTEAEIEKDLSLFSLCDVIPKGNKFDDLKEMTKILLKDNNYKALIQQKQIPPNEEG